MSTLPFFIAFYRHDLIDVISGSLQGGIYFWREEIGKFFSDSISECVEILLSLPVPSPPPFPQAQRSSIHKLRDLWCWRNSTSADYVKIDNTQAEEKKYMIVPAFTVIAFSKWFLILLRNSRFSTFIRLESSFNFDWFHLKRRIYIACVIDEITRIVNIIAYIKLILNSQSCLLSDILRSRATILL